MNRPDVPSVPVQKFLSLLENVRPSGIGYVALCPAHDDNRASLSIAEGNDGRVLLHCFAGCHVADVVAATGLEMRDLFPRTRNRSRRKGGKHHVPHA